jgi:archaellum biogenesis ATPase FlaH/CheY-like chemotaxis protein
MLGSNGHEVSETANGKEALEIVSKSNVDLMLLDVELLGMDGCQVLSQLKQDPRTSAMPIIMMTSVPSPQTESVSLRLGASNILSKPCSAGSLATLVRIALREGEEAARAQTHTSGLPDLADMEPLVYEDPEEPDALAKYSREPSKLINTGGKLTRLDTALGEGLPIGGLSLIEGPSDSGKSVICQYLMYGAISEGWKVALFSSDRIGVDLNPQMKSMGLELPRGVLEDKLSVHTIARPSTEEPAGLLIGKLVSEIESLPESCGLVVVDGISDIAFLCDDREVMGLFSTLKQLCSAGRAIVVVAQNAAFENSLLSRLHQLCDTHIVMSNETVRSKQVSKLNASKVNKMENRSENGFFFNVEADFGVNIVPVSQVRL